MQVARDSSEAVYYWVSYGNRTRLAFFSSSLHFAWHSSLLWHISCALLSICSACPCPLHCVTIYNNINNLSLTLTYWRKEQIHANLASTQEKYGSSRTHTFVCMLELATVWSNNKEPIRNVRKLAQGSPKQFSTDFLNKDLIKKCEGICLRSSRTNFHRLVIQT